MLGRGVEDELGIGCPPFDLLAEVGTEFLEVVRQGLESHFHVGAVLLGFASGIDRHPLRWDGADLPPASGGRQDAPVDRVADDIGPHRPDQSALQDHLAEREAAVGLGDDQSHGRATDLAGIRRELERDHPERGIPPQVFEEAGEGGRRAVGLEAVERLVGLQRDQLAADNALERYRIAALPRAGVAADHEVAVVVDLAARRLEDAGHVGVVLHRVLLQRQQLHLVKDVIDGMLDRGMGTHAARPFRLMDVEDCLGREIPPFAVVLQHPVKDRRAPGIEADSVDGVL